MIVIVTVGARFAGTLWAWLCAAVLHSLGYNASVHRDSTAVLSDELLLPSGRGPERATVGMGSG